MYRYTALRLADLAAVDEAGATSWDYARSKQLHYCMLILASFLLEQRQSVQVASSEFVVWEYKGAREPEVRESGVRERGIKEQEAREHGVRESEARKHGVSES